MESTVYVSRLTVDIPSRKPGHVHRAGTEVAPIEKLNPEDGGSFWLVEVRVKDESIEGGYWYETLEIHADEAAVFEEIEDEGLDEDTYGDTYDLVS